ncbi:MAG: AbrB/MazE/SpoVT family DNA-binding domain-containing protein [Candidatus Hydrothermarchaeales archaeon]
MKNKELGRIPKNVIPEITHMSSKGQIVIPKNIRDSLAVGIGDSFAIFRTSENTLILKPIKTPSIEEDLKILKEINKAWKRIERGEYRKAKVDDFLEELKEW